MMTQTDLVCSKCVGRQTVNNIVMKVNSKVMVTTVPPSQPLAYTRRPIFISASVCTKFLLELCCWFQIRATRHDFTELVYADI
jgi:hypothetical protein